MPVPNFADKYKGRAILTPEAMLAYRQRAGMLPKGAGPEAVILCLQRGLPERVKRRHPIRSIGRINGDLYALHKAPGSLAVLTNFGLGAPQMAGLAEELIAWGARKLVSISMAGGLQPDLKPGDIVVCDRALRDEGTSHHYLPSAKFVDANGELAKDLTAALQARGIQVEVGATWTTDATFRETDVEVRQYQGEGIKTVEMETAALFAVAQVRGVQAASIFVVGDSLAGGEWRAPHDLRLLDRSFEVVYDAAIEVLSEAAS
ncbi:MAG: nucleoside phosphorylase [Anaerolineales bacterium]